MKNNPFFRKKTGFYFRKTVNMSKSGAYMKINFNTHECKTAYMKTLLKHLIMKAYKPNS